MDYEYKECLNPILAKLPFHSYNNLYQYSKTDFDKLKIIGNLRSLSKRYDNMTILNLLTDKSIVKLPCRKCINCALKKSKEWSTRNCLESRDFPKDLCWFLTITYDNDNLKAVYKNVSLSKTDLSNFLKSLRVKFGNGIRFFASGEYGSKTFRPHYHLLLYNLDLSKSSIEFLFRKDNFDYYKCEDIEKIWRKGMCVLCKFDEFEAQYVSQYTTKKIYDFKNQDMYKALQMIPPFIQMSRRPGIANNYYNKHKDEFYVKYNDTLIFHQDFKTVHIKPFAFFDKKLGIENPHLLSFLKHNRRIFANQNDYFETHELVIPVYQFLADSERKIKKIKERSREYEV